MTNCRRFIGALVAFALSIPSAAIAQVETAGEAERWHDLAERLEPAALISVRLKDGSRTRGTLVGVGSSSMTFAPKTRIPVPPRDIRFDDVASIERTKQGMNPGAKVVISAASVVGGMLAIAALIFASGID